MSEETEQLDPKPTSDLVYPDKPAIRYEDAAQRATVTGWQCKTCGRFWGKDEHMARYCCATDKPCGCGKRIEKMCGACDECHAKARDERWEKALACAVDWDGETPLALFESDTYFFNADAVLDYLDEHDAAGVRLVLCSPNNGSHFNMADFLCDDLPDGEVDLDDKEINATVNAWIEANAPFSWSGTGIAVRLESVTGIKESL